MSNKLPEWSVELLTGLAFWIGYKQQYFRHYRLSEGAIVCEALSLINSKIENRKKLIPEVMYRKLYPKDSNYNRLERADIIIASKDADKNNISKTVEDVIEVKRYSAGKTLIENDLNRLAKLLSSSDNENLRCFLIVVSESKRPKIYVNSNGNARKKPILLNNGYRVHVRRVCKTTSSFRAGNIKNANYACLFEVIKT